MFYHINQLADPPHSLWSDASVGVDALPPPPPPATRWWHASPGCQLLSCSRWSAAVKHFMLIISCLAQWNGLSSAEVAIQQNVLT